MQQGALSSVDAENANMIPVFVNNCEGLLVIPKEEDSSSTLMWLDPEHDLQFTLMRRLVRRTFCTWQRACIWSKRRNEIFLQKAVRKDTPFRVYWVEAETICREHAKGGVFCEKSCGSGALWPCAHNRNCSAGCRATSSRILIVADFR